MKIPSNLTLKNFLIAAGVLGAALFIWVASPLREHTWLGAALAALLAIDVGAILLKTWGRTTAHALNSFITTSLVLAILVLVNYFAQIFEFKLDLTKSGIHTLSDQTVKVMKGLNQEVQAVLFGKYQHKEQFRPLLENYADLNRKFKVEYVDPDKEPTRTEQAGVKKYGALQLIVGERKAMIDELDEEKLTNEIIKLTKGVSQTLCAIKGHGELDFDSRERNGLAALSQGLTEQAYEIKPVNLPEEMKIPSECLAIAIMGATRSFFEPEIKVIDEYLKNGGSAVIGLALNATGPEAAPELVKMLEDWHIVSPRELVVDPNPLFQQLGMDASIPIVQQFATDHAITREARIQAAFPFTRPVNIKPGAPAALNVQWLAKTSPRSWAEKSLDQLSKGVKYDEGSEQKGPLNVAVTVEGKHPSGKATKSSRLVVFGTASFANNYYARMGGNYDLALNAVSWVMADESLISIRKKENDDSRIELSGQAQVTIFWLVVVLIPLVVTAGGVWFWLKRRKL